jgi:outer membrane protein assembly factor BamD (BamD/ComL family)
LRATTRPVWFRLIVLGAALLAARWAGAVEVWMPETGEVQLEAAPTGAAGEAYKRAVALIGAGQWSGGIADLRTLIAANPGADWLPQARSVLARGLIASGDYTAGFNELETLRTENPGTALAAQAHDLQVAAARELAKNHPYSAATLFDRLKTQAKTPEEEALIQKEKADAYLDGRLYLEAQDEYLQLATNYRDSIWAPYAWFRIADCQWRMARWLDLGAQPFQQADKAFKDYLSVYPDGSNAPEAKALIVEVHRREAQKYRQIAQFYITAEKRPWAAVNYLNYLISDFADTPQAAWARTQLERIGAPPAPPLAGWPREFKMFGVAPVSEGK